MTDAAETGTSIQEKVGFLRRPESYPGGVAQVEAIETHMSWVFLAGDRVFKLKKPVRYNFLDFSTLEARRLDSERELELNRRLAGDTYIGMVPITTAGEDGLRLDGSGRVVDWLVEMHRLPESRTLSAAIVDGSVQQADIDGIAGKLIDFYSQLTPQPLTGEEYHAMFAGWIEENHAALNHPGYGLPTETVLQLYEHQRRFLQDSGRLLVQRAGENRIIEGHGDLRPEHVFLTDPPVIIDCLEFNRAFRILDPVDELTYLGLECDRLGAAWIGQRILENYIAATGDRPPGELITFYRLFRSCLRAKIAVWHIEDHAIDDHEKWRRRALEYLQVAERCLGCDRH